jgi:hypothetical protein
MRQAERHQRRAMTALLVGIDLSELQLEVLQLLEAKGVLQPEERRRVQGDFGACLELAGGAPRVLREAIANIRGRQPTSAEGRSMWTEKKVASLKALRARGCSCAEIAAALRTSRSAVCAKAARLGLPTPPDHRAPPWPRPASTATVAR